MPVSQIFVLFLKAHSDSSIFVSIVWLTTQSLQDSVAFLPLNPAISPMRNQGRQKLATLDAKEFSQLVTDMLLDTRRRQNISLETGEV